MRLCSSTGHSLPQSGKECVTVSESASQSVPFAIVPRWVLRMVGTELSVHDLAVYVAISDRCNGRSRDAFPGLRRIAADIGVSKTTVSKSVETLKREGCIEVSQRARADGQMTNHYHLPQERVYQQVTHPVPAGGTPGVPAGGTEQEPENKNQQQEPTMAPAALDEPSWVGSALTFPVAKRDATDNGELDTGWTPKPTPHQWQHPTHGFRDVLWEATSEAFGDPPTKRERDRRSKAVALFREGGCDPAEIRTLKMAYELKMGHAANTDLAVASHIANCRRWANEVTTVDPKALQRTMQRELQERASLRLLQAGPGDEDSDSPREIALRRARGQS